MPKFISGGRRSRPFIFAISALALAACSTEGETTSAATEEAVPTKKYTLADLDGILSDPVKRSDMIVKVMGSTDREDTYAFLKFHVYGFAGENVIPFFTMNNVIVQKWTPTEDPGYYDMSHYEVAYYSEFDSAEPIETWENPITGEVIDIPPFILGPIFRQYTPEGVIAPGVAPNPLNISVIGDRVFIPTHSVDRLPNPMTGPEWGPYAGDPTVYWDSMLTFSADIEDVLNEDTAKADAEIHMQNLVSWNPYFKMGLRPGRTMVRAFGTHLDSLDDIPPEARAGLKKYTPEIFDTDNWEGFRMDNIDFMNEVKAKIDSGEIVIEEVSQE